MTAQEIESLVAAFQSCTLPKSEWTHQAHLKVGTWHVRQFGKDEALDRLRRGIRRLNDSHGVPNSESRGYHETITRVYLMLIDEFLQRVPSETPLEDVVKRLLSSQIALKDFLLSFYSRELLMSARARREWVEPDVAPVRLDPFRRIPTTERVRSPWKNGNGWTEEIAIFPSGATLENFDWRVSIAGTDKSGPFSLFPGIDRSLVILQGSLSLSVVAKSAVKLDPDSRPISFSGDEVTVADLIDAPLVDLNVMTRRGRFSHRIERRLLKSDSSILLGNGITLIVETETRDVTVFEQPSTATTPPLKGGDSYIIEIDPF